MSPRDPRPAEPDLWEEVEHLHPHAEGPEASVGTRQTVPVEPVPTRPDDGPSPSPEPAPGAVRTGALNHPAQDADAAPDEQTRRVGDPVAGRPAIDDPVAGRPATQDPVAGHPVIDDPVAAAAWEEEPPRVPVFRWRLVGGAVMVLVVAVAAWWAVTWLMRPATPESVPVDAQSLVEAGGEDHADSVAVGEGEGTANGEGPLSGREAEEDASEATGDSGDSDGSGRDSDSDDDADDSTGAGVPVARVRVHVIGEVRSPGVVTVPADARTADAIAAAGGTTREAQAERINLAAPLIDGQQVLVPGERTTEEQLESVQAQAWAVEGPAGGGADPGAGPGAGGGQAAPGVGAEDGAAAGRDGGRTGQGGGADEPDGSGPGGDAGQGRGDDGTVNLNSADSTALQTLPGVGPATAEKIIAHREQVGEFQSLTDLDAVSGIGPATLERLAPLVTW